MNFLGVNFPVSNVPVLDTGFVPLGKFFATVKANGKEDFAVAVERTNGSVSVYKTKIFGTADMAAADDYYIDRLVKFMLWSKGGYKVYLCGNETVCKAVAAAYTPNGSRSFDYGFMTRVYERPMEVVCLPYSQCPVQHEMSKAVGRHLDGCRIGFDAGGSDRKVSAVIDGNPVYSEEVVWFPKTESDPDYHFNGIVEAMKTAASKMPRVDAIGVSSAGVYVDNRTMVASLFLKVSDADFDAKVKDIYTRAAKEIGENIPIEVANDGDVTALAGAMGLEDTGVLGIAMGTSEAVGYVDLEGKITGWLNELAFAPVDGQSDAMEDEWSGDIGCGVKYFSQDGVIKLAPRAGITLQGSSPAEKLKEVQALMLEDDERAANIYDSLGVCLGHTLALYAQFYDIKHVLMLGRLTSGKGGDILLARTNEVLKNEYPEITFVAEAPDEKAKRVGQSVAAASLPEVL